MTEFKTLSDEIIYAPTFQLLNNPVEEFKTAPVIEAVKVKEFIKLLEEDLTGKNCDCDSCKEIKNKIKKRAGKKLGGN